MARGYNAGESRNLSRSKDVRDEISNLRSQYEEGQLGDGKVPSNKRLQELAEAAVESTKGMKDKDEIAATRQELYESEVDAQQADESRRYAAGEGEDAFDRYSNMSPEFKSEMELAKQREAEREPLRQAISNALNERFNAYKNGSITDQNKAEQKVEDANKKLADYNKKAKENDLASRAKDSVKVEKGQTATSKGIFNTQYYAWNTDPSHGWLRVPAVDVEKSGFIPSELSPKRGDSYYLEEDADAPGFLKAAGFDKLPQDKLKFPENNQDTEFKFPRTSFGIGKTNKNK
jgi:hypothetical protein